MAKEKNTFYHRSAKEEEGQYRIAFIIPRLTDVWTGKPIKRRK